MSGTGQHYIPKSLLRQFEAARTGKFPQVIVFEENKKPYLASINKFARINNFYSKKIGGEETLDDKITDYENSRLTELLTYFIEKSSNEKIDSGLAAEMLVHFAVRGAYIRHLIEAGGKEVISSATEMLTNRDGARALVGMDRLMPSEVIRDAIQETIESNNNLIPEGLPRPLFEVIVYAFMRESYDEITREMRPDLKTMLGGLISVMPEIIAKSHQEVLSEELNPERRISLLEEFDWLIHDSAEPHNILPDCVVIGMAENKFMPYMLAEHENLQAVIMPISPTRLVVGTKDHGVNPRISEFNALAASCSSIYFVSSIDNSVIRNLKERIGESSKIMVAEAAKQAVKERSGEVVEVKHVNSDEYSVSKGDKVSQIKLHINCNDCDKIAESAVKEIQKLVLSLSKVMPLSCVEEMHFTLEYDEVCGSGFGESAERGETQKSSDGFIGVAKSQRYFGEGGLRIKIFFPWGIARALLDDPKTNENQIATHVVVYQLAMAAYMEILDKYIPGYQMTSVGEEFESYFMPIIYDVLAAYFASKISSVFWTSGSEAYEEVLLEEFENTENAIKAAKVKYQNDKNVDAILYTSVKEVGRVLIATANYLGAVDEGKTISVHGNNRLWRCLEEYDLLKWIEVYSRDLSRVFNNDSNLKYVTELAGMNIHIQRLLWLFKIFPWRTEDGRIYVNISY